MFASGRPTCQPPPPKLSLGRRASRRPHNLSLHHDPRTDANTRPLRDGKRPAARKTRGRVQSPKARVTQKIPKHRMQFVPELASRTPRPFLRHRGSIKDFEEIFGGVPRVAGTVLNRKDASASQEGTPVTPLGNASHRPCSAGNPRACKSTLTIPIPRAKTPGIEESVNHLPRRRRRTNRKGLRPSKRPTPSRARQKNVFPKTSSPVITRPSSAVKGSCSKTRSRPDRWRIVDAIYELESGKCCGGWK